MERGGAWLLHTAAVCLVLAGYLWSPTSLLTVGAISIAISVGTVLWSVLSSTGQTGTHERQEAKKPQDLSSY